MGAWVQGCLGVGVLVCRGAGVQGCWHAVVMGCWLAEVPAYRGARMLRCMGTWEQGGRAVGVLG